MKVFFKFLFSILALPFLLPWFLADKVFEYFIQPSIFKKYNLEIASRKVWIRRITTILIVALVVFYLVKKVIFFAGKFHGFFVILGNLGTFLKLVYNDFARTAQFLVRPINHIIYYLMGGEIRSFKDFILCFYSCLVPIIFAVNLLYRQIKTRSLINRAARFRNQAVRDVDIIRFVEAAKEDEIFWGLDLTRKGKPFYVKRNWLKGHVQVIGGAGSGKTESIIQPTWFQEVRRNVATIVLDGKASRHNVDRFFTIASSLAQGQDIYYFNPADPARSASYNPLLRGTVGDVKHKILASVNWADYSAASREKLDSALSMFLRAMQETNTFFNFGDLLEFFQSFDYLQRQSERVADPYLRNNLGDILMNYSRFQASMAFFIELLRDLVQTEYAQLLNTNKPKIDIVDIYRSRKDCYFTLPLQNNESTVRFLGRLILQDIQHCFHYIATNSDNIRAEEGLLIIDEMAKFVSPNFLELLQASRDVGISMFYTNRSLTELKNPALNLSQVFIDQLADHTNGLCCFQSGSQESIHMLLERIGKAAAPGTTGTDQVGFNIMDPDFLKHLEVGRCLVFFRRPRFLTVLKTGYFKFDKLMRFNGERGSSKGK